MSAVTFGFYTINDLPELLITSGTSHTIEATVTDESGSPIDLNTMTSIGMDFAHYGQPDYKVLAKSGSPSATDSSVMVITLSEDDTTTFLEGKYIYQPIIVDVSGKPFRPGQGVITVRQGIGVS